MCQRPLIRVVLVLGVLLALPAHAQAPICSELQPPTLTGFGLEPDEYYGRRIWVDLTLFDGQVIDDYEATPIVYESGRPYQPGQWRDNWTGPSTEDCVAQLLQFSEYVVGTLETGFPPFEYDPPLPPEFVELLLQEATPPTYLPAVIFD